MKKAIQGIFNRVNALFKKYFKVKLIKRSTIAFPLVFAIVLCTFSALLSNYSIAVAVSYNGENVGYVTSEEVFSKAVTSVLKNVDTKTEKSIDKSFTTTGEVVANSQVVNQKTLSDEIVKKVEKIGEGYALYRNSLLYAVCATESEITDTLEDYLINNSNGQDETDFIDAFTIKCGVYSVVDFVTKDQLYRKMVTDPPPISGVKYITTEEVVPFKTVTKKSDKYILGEKVVEREGSNGVKSVVTKQYISGNKILKTEEVSQTVAVTAIDKIVIEGVSKKFALLFPLPESSNYNITSSYGEWRGSYAHGGTDIIVDYGTEIYACYNGTVIEAGYSPYGWGNTVLIDHGNGFKTRYAHCSEVSVTAGQSVSAGDVLGLVGATGDADCNHLHLELYKNGTRIDPVPYLK